MKNRKTNACIFDMDGLLINSEPFWRYAEMQVFAEVGVDLTYELCGTTAGMRINEVVDYWFRQFPWNGPSPAQITAKITDVLTDMIRKDGEALPGVINTLKAVRNEALPMALASSSMYSVIDVVLDKLEIRDFFDVVYSGEEESIGKPHPGTFLTAASKLGVRPDECCVFEDSFHGVIAGLAANMKVVAVIEEVNRGDCRFHCAHHQLEALTEFHMGLIN